MGQAEGSAHPGTETEGGYGQVQEALVHVQEDAHLYCGQLHGGTGLCDGGNVRAAGSECPIRFDYGCGG